MILVLLLANAVVGFWGRTSGGNAIARPEGDAGDQGGELKRDGKWVNPAAREVVPGDLIRLAFFGDIVPCRRAPRWTGDQISVDQLGADRGVLARHAQVRARPFSAVRSFVAAKSVRSSTGDGRRNRSSGKTAELVEDGRSRSATSRRAVLRDRRLPDRPRGRPWSTRHSSAVAYVSAASRMLTTCCSLRWCSTVAASPRRDARPCCR